MTDLQAALKDVPFTSTSPQPIQLTSTLFQTHMPAPQTPPPTIPNTYNQFVNMYNQWQHLVDEVGVEAAGLPPMLENFQPSAPTPTSIEIWTPPQPYYQFLPVRNGSWSIQSHHAPLPSSPWRPSQLHMNIPPTMATSATHTNGLGKSISAKPDMFDGDKSKYVQWSRQIAVYFAGFDNEPNDAQKILMTLSYMKGNNVAGRFADLYVQQQGDQIWWTLYSEFKTRIDNLFMPAALKRQAEMSC